MGVQTGVRVRVEGTVQGVGFRPFVHRLATKLGLSGGVRNLGDAGVEIQAMGSRESVEAFVRGLRDEAPPLAVIVKFEVECVSRCGVQCSDASFSILPSRAGAEGSGTIPPDVGICEACLEDLRGESRYRGYWATSCTNCGARFTLVEALPYDRERTSMRDFPLCEGCLREYTDPADRRFHAQATACEQCGPRLEFVAGHEGPSPQAGDPLSLAVAALRAGRIVAIKGIGGSHLACDATREDVVARLRRRRLRFFQPFAVMAAEEMVPRVAQPSAEDLEALRSWQRPIVVLRALSDGLIAPSVNPGMHTVGVMLPYTGLHHALFDQIEFPLVMTSANLPGLPMAIENEAMLSELDGIADDLLLHDRRIVARCDDSVVTVSGGARRFIRRSRGWAPAPIDIDLGPTPILALGAELQNAVALYVEGKCYLSQYLGDVDKLETLEAQRSGIEHLLALTGQRLPATIVCDRHPQFLTTQLAEELAEAAGTQPVRVQHHHAHLASVMGEHGLRRCVGIAADGIGYGDDGRIWGGEVLLADRSEYARVGGLASVPMPGGDLATRFPARMMAGILFAGGVRGEPLRQTLARHVRFPKGVREREVVLRQLETDTNVPMTSSAGRFLDAVSALLGLCHERTYEGEPAMRLEAAADGGLPRRVAIRLCAPPGTRGPEDPVASFLDVPRHFLELLRMWEGGAPREEVAATAQDVLARGLAALAVRTARANGIADVCLSGGVAYNDTIASTIRTEVEGAGLRFFANEAVPCGDGGIALGQVVVAAAQRGRAVRAALSLNETLGALDS